MKREVLEHPKMLDLCDALQVPLYHGIGMLEGVWQFAKRFAPAGDIGKYSDNSIARFIQWDRTPSELIEALVRCRWIDPHDMRRLVIHDWATHCDDSVHMQLARAVRCFWNGERPSLKRFGQKERERIQGLFDNADPASLMDAHAVRLPCALPSPPLPNPTKPSPTIPCVTHTSENAQSAHVVRTESAKRLKLRRCPKTFEPAQDHVDLAAQLGIDLAFELARMRDHEFKEGRTDWDAVLRNWLREAHTRQNKNGTNNRNMSAAQQTQDVVRRQLKLAEESDDI